MISTAIGVTRAIGSGTMRSILGTDPAAGAQFVETVPAGVQWRIVSIRVRLITNAVAATRRINVGLSGPAGTFYRGEASSTQLASQSVRYNIGVLDLGPVATVQLPEGVIIPETFTFFSVVGGFQAGDNWQAPIFLVEEWPIP